MSMGLCPTRASRAREPRYNTFRIKGLFTWNGTDRRPSGVGFVCFNALEDTKQNKLTPLDRGPPLHVNRVLVVRPEDCS